MGTDTPGIPIAGGVEAGAGPRARARGTYLEVIHSWVVTVDHKKLGILYIGYALIFLVVAGIEAMLIRIQLFFPHNTFISAATFNRLFTMHGTTMVFLVGMPILFGFGNYLVPLMVGARDMAFPRLNAFSFWISAFAGLLLYYSFVGGVGLAGTGSAPDVAWFAYAPLDGAGVFAGPYGGLLGGVDSGERHREHRDGDQYYCHGFLHALQGDDAAAHSAAAVAVCDGVVPGAGDDQPAYGGAGDAADRSLSGRAFLRYAGGRVGDSVGALFLDLRTSGSVRAGVAGVRFRE